jgi:hypothetical protein
MSRAARTDFEEYGLSRGSFPVSGRLLLLTVDFEAFAPEMLPLWLDAMQYWAACAKRFELRYCFFLSVEDALRIRAAGREEYDQLLAAMRAIDDAGSLFYAHNHFVFDSETGQKRQMDRESPVFLPDYGKRRSVFYDVCRRHCLDWATWMAIVRESFEHVLTDAGCRKPTFSVFRAGGWDYGESLADLSRYLGGLAAAGFRGDSSACQGRFGTPDWRVGTDYGRNVFWVDHGLLEIAPTWALDASVSPRSAAAVRNYLSLGKQGGLWIGRKGACVVVLHFDHLFRAWPEGMAGRFSPKAIWTVRTLIDRLFRGLGFLRSVLRLKNVTFDDLHAP